MRIQFILAMFVALTLPSISFAHSGRTNGDGCHTNRKSGEFHCHSGGASTMGEAGEFCHVVRGENRCGYSSSSCADLRGQFGGECIPE